MKILTVSTFFILLVTACTKDKSDLDFWSCHAKAGYDSAEVRSGLVGEWKLIGQVQGDKVLQAQTECTAKFCSNGMLSFTENSIESPQIFWSIKKSLDGGDDNFNLVFDKFKSKYFLGLIFFCGNRVEFYGAYGGGGGGGTAYIFENVNKKSVCAD